MYKFIISFISALPTSKYLSNFWNLGSWLGLVLVLQILSGLLLTLSYTPALEVAYQSIDYLTREFSGGWLLRIFHSNGASLFMALLYLHSLKAVFYSSSRLLWVWVWGILLFFFSMGVSFFGYLLVWAQMSYWAGIVITSLITVLPFGEDLLMWLWGGYSAGDAFLHFSFVVHFLLPWFVMLLVVAHLYALHKEGSTSLLSYSGHNLKGWFTPFYSSKDILSVFLWFLFIDCILVVPFFLSDPEMFSEANPLSSPLHIVPEWYFCAHYEILRAYASKTTGVVCLVLSILGPILGGFARSEIPVISSLSKSLGVSLFIIFFLLGWLGQSLAMSPFLEFGLFFSIIYFSCLIFILLLSLLMFCCYS